MNPVLEEMFKTGITYLGGGRAVPLHAGLTPQEAAFMDKMLMQYGQPGPTIETGMAQGVGTLVLMENAGGEHHHAIDPHQTEKWTAYAQAPDSNPWESAGVAAVARAGWADRLNLYEVPSHVALPDLARHGHTFMAALIDGYHAFDTTFIDFFYLDLMLETGGMLFIDDVDMPQVNHVARWVETHKFYEPVGRAGNLAGYQKRHHERVHWTTVVPGFYP